MLLTNAHEKNAGKHEVIREEHGFTSDDDLVRHVYVRFGAAAVKLHVPDRGHVCNGSVNTVKYLRVVGVSTL